VLLLVVVTFQEATAVPWRRRLGSRAAGGHRQLPVGA
jgi:hypothetical protein